jgi:hypothetical protein
MWVRFGRLTGIALLLMSAVHGASAAGPATPILAMTESMLTPYTSGGCYSRGVGCTYLTGRTDPGARVTVTVSDTQVPSKVVVTTYAAERDDPAGGLQAGDFQVSPQLTDLGLHGTEASELIFTAIAHDATGAASAPASLLVTKFSATAGDSTAPLLRVTKSPPAFWCSSACGALNGHGSCYANLACPDTVRVAGNAEDNNAFAYGFASEVADVVLTVKNQSDGHVVREFHSAVRRGTQAFFTFDLRHSDYQSFGRYQWVVVAIDAFGHVSNAGNGSFAVVPA